MIGFKLHGIPDDLSKLYCSYFVHGFSFLYLGTTSKATPCVYIPTHTYKFILVDSYIQIQT